VVERKHPDDGKHTRRMNDESDGNEHGCGPGDSEHDSRSKARRPFPDRERNDKRCQSGEAAERDLEPLNIRSDDGNSNAEPGSDASQHDGE
jgi:hypothetical protein